MRDARHSTEREIEVDVSLADPVLGDLDKLHRLIDNLLGNALHHGDGPVRISVDRDDGCARLVFHNRGAAIPPDLLDRLFDPYTRSTRSTGTGLGLYIVHQIACAHAGSVAVTSSEHDGTTFTVKLPVAPP